MEKNKSVDAGKLNEINQEKADLPIILLLHFLWAVDA